MKRLLAVTLISLSVLIVHSTAAQKITLVKKGVPKTVIVIPQKPTIVEIQAAKVLQDYMKRISGASIAIDHDSITHKGGEILIGNVARPDLNNIPKERLDKDGILIKTSGNNLVITGGTDKGILYGVYTFLENYLGCRKYSSAETYVPARKTVTVGPINDMQLPAFSYRENFYRYIRLKAC
jgi:hypothetical protein